MAQVKHKKVKFTAEEMAYDPPDTSDPKRWIVIGRGPKAAFAKARTVRLQPDIARAFPSSAAVNKALRKLIAQMPAPANKRKTA
jgi:hypothetical protein